MYTRLCLKFNTSKYTEKAKEILIFQKCSCTPFMNLLDKYPMFQGGFIWDYIDQAIYVKDEVTGEQVLRYGGDFDDRPSDYEFSGNGIVFADRTEKPATQEVKYYYAKYE